MAWTGHEPLLERWLAPSLTAEVPFREASHGLELSFQALGVGAAVLGWLGALFLYRNGRSELPARLQARFVRAWQVVYDKYYVDELYGATVVRGTLGLSRLLAWFDGRVLDAMVNAAAVATRGFAGIDAFIDRVFIDGAVNGVATLAGRSGRALRMLQTGRVQTYLYGALAGGLVLILLDFLIR